MKFKKLLAKNLQKFVNLAFETNKSSEVADDTGAVFRDFAQPPP